MRSAMLRTLTLTITVAGLSACVTQGTYDDLKKKLDETQQELAEESKQRKTLELALEEEEEKVAKLEEAIEQKKSEMAELEGRIQEQDEEIADLKASYQESQEELAAVVNDRARLKQAASKLKEAMSELARRKAAAEERMSEYRDLLAKFKNMIDAGKLRVTIVDGRMVVALQTDVLFGSGSAKLGKDGEQAIVEVSGILKTMKERRFQIEGHTDNVPISNERYRNNWELAAERALSVVRTMMGAGMPGKRLSAASYGEHRPIATNETEAGRAQNRRIEIVLVPDLSDLPGFGQLQQAVEGQS